MQGRSLLSILKGKNPINWRKEQWYSYWSKPNHYGIRTERYTFIKIPGFQDELYDNKKDPNQLVNRINNPQYKSVLNELEELLIMKKNDVQISENDLPKSSKSESKTKLTKQ